MPAYLRRYQDLKFLYSRDEGTEILLRQRVYRSQDGAIETPITSLFQARVQVTDDTVPPRTFTPRYVRACFENTRNQSGESRLTAFIPYRPGDPNLQAHVQEILQFDNVLSGDYQGETDNVEELQTRFLEGLAEIMRDAVSDAIGEVSDELRGVVLDILLNLLLGAIL